MSLISRFVDTAFTKINTERLPSMGAAFGVSGAQQPGGQLAQLSAMSSVGWLFAVVNRISQSIATQQWKLYRVQGGQREEVDTHPALDLWQSANPFVTREDFLETSQQHMELVGEMWWVLVRNGAGIPIELQVVRPDRMRPIPHPTEFIAGYEYRIGPTAMALEKDDVIYTRNPNPLDSYRGIGVIQSLMVDLGAERLAAEWMANFFRNSAEPGGIIEFPQNLQDADFQRLAERWRFQHQGVANAHRVAILERGTWKDRKLTQRDMQFEQLRRFERDQILGAFGMPLAIMGITESVNRANAEAAEVMYARWLVRPRLMRIRSALNEKLLKLYPDGDGLEFDFVDPVPENRQELINEGTLGYEKKILTLNEARRRFGEDDWEGPEGDALHTPSLPPMLAPPPPEADDEPEDNPEEPAEEAAGYGPRRPRRAKVEPIPDYPDEANRSANRMERGWKRRLATELQALIAFLEREDKSTGPSMTASHTTGQPISRQGPVRALNAALSVTETGLDTKLTPDVVARYDWNWWAKYGDEVVDELQESFFAVLSTARPRASVPELQRLAAVYAERRGAELLRIGMVDLGQGPPIGQPPFPEGTRMLIPSLAEVTRAEVGQLVADTIRQGDSLKTLTKKLKEGGTFTTARARRIARTETAFALGDGQRVAAKSEGRTEKRWVSQGDFHVSDLCALNDAMGWIPIDQIFDSGDMTIPQHPNCRCTVIYRNTPVSEQEELRAFVGEIRCPQCNRKNGENVAVGTRIRCRRCKHEWEVTHDEHDSTVATGGD